VCFAKASGDYDAAEAYFGEFSKLIDDAKFTAEQVYNANETCLCWRYIPRKTDDDAM
jgi:hypothetical protein